MDLRHLTDKALLADTKMLAASEREVTIRILHHIKEIDRRRLYSDLGCPSLFEYCIRELGYSEPSAQRRIVAARLLKDLPQIEEKIEAGELSLTNLALANQHFRSQSIETSAEKLAVLNKISKMSKRECEHKLIELSGEEKTPKEGQRRISAEKTLVSIVLMDKTLNALNEIKGLLGDHLTMDELLKKIISKARETIIREKFKQTKQNHLPSPEKVNRVIPTAVKREVYARDKKCTNCGSTHNLNYDHQLPFALGGESSAKNVRLLCFNCNQRKRIKAKL